MRDESGVGGIRWDDRFTNHQLLERNAPASNFFDSCPRKCSFSSGHEQLIIGVIAGVSLIVELDEVEVDHTADCLVDCSIASILVVSGREVWSLRSMGENMVRNLLSDCLSEVDQPLLSNSLLQSSVVFPISVSSVKVVVKNELSKFMSTSGCVHASCCGELCGSKGTDNDLDAMCVIFLHDVLLDFLSISSESSDSIVSEVFPK